MAGATGQGRALGQPVPPELATVAPEARTGWMFFGYIPLRRGILEHIRNGRMNHSEALAYEIILLEANSSTGVWWGSSKALMAYNFSWASARRALEGLEREGYIKRFPTPGRHANYPILVNKYGVTSGKHAGTVLNAKQSVYPHTMVYMCQGGGQGGEQACGPHQEVEVEREREKKQRQLPEQAGNQTAVEKKPLRNYQERWLRARMESRAGGQPRTASPNGCVNCGEPTPRLDDPFCKPCFVKAQENR